MKPTVFLVDDDPLAESSVQRLLRRFPLKLRCFLAAEQALTELTSSPPELIITDIRMPEMDGLQFMAKVLGLDPEIAVIVITGAGDVQTAVKALQDGAFDFIEKANLPELLPETVQRALRQRQLLTENGLIRNRLNTLAPSTGGLVGSSPPMHELRETISAVAAADANVLLHGETGTGKELVAKVLHAESKRCDGNFVAINCGAVPESIFDSEMFGHVPGAYTGATKLRVGKVEHASGGTLFLDEVDSMPLHMQVKLLRVLQELSFERLGCNTLIPVDIRVISATQQDLAAQCAAGKFREDLYYRLNVIPIEVPPLRKRGNDIFVLFRLFLERACLRFERELPELNQAHVYSLLAREWPGNVRELQNLAERVALTGTGALGTLSMDAPNDLPLAAFMAGVEKQAIELKLREYAGSVEKTYKALGISRKTLYDKFNKHRIKRSDFTQ